MSALPNKIKIRTTPHFAVVYATALLLGVSLWTDSGQLRLELLSVNRGNPASGRVQVVTISTRAGVNVCKARPWGPRRTAELAGS